MFLFFAYLDFLRSSPALLSRLLSLSPSPPQDFTSLFRLTPTSTILTTPFHLRPQLNPGNSKVRCLSPFTFSPLSPTLRGSTPLVTRLNQSFNSLTMFRLSLVTAAALLSIPSVYASVVSTSVFPNSACAGASSINGLVGVGRVTLANGEVETHCGCPSVSFPGKININTRVVLIHCLTLAPLSLSYRRTTSPTSLPVNCPLTVNPSATRFSTSTLEVSPRHAESFPAPERKFFCFSLSCTVHREALLTASLTPSSDCPTTVINSVVVDQDDCFNSEKGAIGIVTVDGESKCGCASVSYDTLFFQEDERALFNELCFAFPEIGLDSLRILCLPCSCQRSRYLRFRRLGLPRNGLHSQGEGRVRCRLRRGTFFKNSE